MGGGGARITTVTAAQGTRDYQPYPLGTQRPHNPTAAGGEFKFAAPTDKQLRPSGAHGETENPSCRMQQHKKYTQRIQIYIAPDFPKQKFIFLYDFCIFQNDFLETVQGFQEALAQTKNRKN